MNNYNIAISNKPMTFSHSTSTHYSSAHQNGVGGSVYQKMINGEGVRTISEFAPDKQAKHRAFHVKDNRMVREMGPSDFHANPAMAALLPSHVINDSLNVGQLAQPVKKVAVAIPVSHVLLI